MIEEKIDNRDFIKILTCQYCEREFLEPNYDGEELITTFNKNDMDFCCLECLIAFDRNEALDRLSLVLASIDYRLDTINILTKEFLIQKFGK